MHNSEIARRLYELALFMDMAGVQFKPRAYEKAATAVGDAEQPLAVLHAQGGVKALMSVPGVGKGIAEKIAELLETGHIGELEKYRAETPVEILELTAIDGLGPRSVKTLYDELGVRTLEELEHALHAGSIRHLPRFGEKSEQKILRGLEFLRQGQGRLPIGEVLPLARAVEERLRALPGVEEAAIAGSLRRRKETIGDLDFIVVSSAPDPVMEAFCAMPEVVQVQARGHTKSMVRLRLGVDADLRVVPAPSFGAAMAYFTGSKTHNIHMRKLAIEQELKLNEYGLFRGETSIAGKTEEEIYRALGLPYIEPELREDSGEIEAARAGRLPNLVGPGDILGDLQTQTDWTDGKNTMEEMALAAKKLGRQYIAITDHTRDLAMMGLDEARLLEHSQAVRALDRRLDGIRVLAGAEVNIRKDGTLDIADEVLAQLDVVGVAIHSHFGLPRDEMTRRVLRALESPHADIFFHPTARKLGSRPPVELDLDAVIAAARRTGTAMEIDAHPHRLDLKDEHVRRCVQAGVSLVIDSDAHHVSELRYPDDYGISLSRRGWADRSLVLNTRPVGEFLAALKKPAS